VDLLDPRACAYARYAELLGDAETHVGSSGGSEHGGIEGLAGVTFDTAAHDFSGAGDACGAHF
jgi:hypothetical protein